MRTISDLRQVLNDDGEDVSWQAQAACRYFKHSADIWYPETVDTSGRRYMATLIEQAKEICATCNVTDECLTYALNNREPHGIWGGKTPLERGELLAGRTTT